jgi:hypothetical protein
MIMMIVIMTKTEGEDDDDEVGSSGRCWIGIRKKYDLFCPVLLTLMLCIIFYCFAKRM